MFKHAILSIATVLSLCANIAAAAEGIYVCNGQTPITLKFQNGLPTVSLTMDGAKVDAIIDTGSPITLADERLVRSETIEQQHNTFQSYYDDFETKRTTLKDVNLANCHQAEVQAHTITNGGEDIVQILDGGIILGRDFLDAYDFIFDGPNSLAFVRRAKRPRDRTEFAYAIEYKIGEEKDICLFDSGFASDETMFVHRGAPILAAEKTFQSLGVKHHGASDSGYARIVSMFGRLANSNPGSFLAAIEAPSLSNSHTPALGYCIVGSKIMQKRKLILRSEKRLVTTGYVSKD